jgi:hypothetical protein
MSIDIGANATSALRINTVWRCSLLILQDLKKALTAEDAEDAEDKMQTIHTGK